MRELNIYTNALIVTNISTYNYLPTYETLKLVQNWIV